MSEKLIREWVQQLLLEAEGDDTPTAPDEIEPDPESADDEILSLKDSGLIKWKSALSSANGKNKESIDIVVKNGPTGDKDNANGEFAIIAGLNAMAGGTDDPTDEGASPFRQVGGSADYDIECVVDEVSIAGVTFKKGKYEAKTQGSGKEGEPSGGKLARLGQAKAISVASQPPLAGLKDVGTAYGTKIYRKFKVNDTGSVVITKGSEEVDLSEILGADSDVLGALKAAIEYFEEGWTKTKGRWYSMMGLELATGTVAKIMGKEGNSVSAELESLMATLAAALGEPPPDGSQEEPITVKVISDEGTPEDVEDNQEFEFDKLTWSADVSRVMKARQQGSSLSADDVNSQSEDVEKVKTVLQDLWTTISRNKAEIDKLTQQEFWDNLAQDSQGDSGVMGIFTVDDQRSDANKKASKPQSGGFRYFTFPELTVTSITQGGRIVLAPKARAQPEAENAGVKRSDYNLLREFIREALLTEAFTKTDEKAIEVMARKQIDKKWKEHEKKIDKMFDERDKTLFRNDAFYKVIARIYQELQRAYAEDQFKYATRYTRKDIPLARFRPS